MPLHMSVRMDCTQIHQNVPLRTGLRTVARVARAGAGAAGAAGAAVGLAASVNAAAAKFSAESDAATECNQSMQS